MPSHRTQCHLHTTRQRHRALHDRVVDVQHRVHSTTGRIPVGDLNERIPQRVGRAGDYATGGIPGVGDDRVIRVHCGAIGEAGGHVPVGHVIRHRLIRQHDRVAVRIARGRRAPVASDPQSFARHTALSYFHFRQHPRIDLVRP